MMRSIDPREYKLDNFTVDDAIERNVPSNIPKVAVHYRAILTVQS